MPPKLFTLKILLFIILVLLGFPTLQFFICFKINVHCFKKQMLIYIYSCDCQFLCPMLFFLPPSGYNFLLSEVYYAVYLILSLFLNDRLARYNTLY